MENKTKIVIKVKSVYGRDLIYPVCYFAQQFTRLTGIKTLSTRDLSIIRNLGFEVIEKSNVLTEQTC